MFVSTSSRGPIELKRRELLLSLSAFALVAGAGLGAIPALAQQKKGPSEVPVEELMKPGVLSEITLGSPSAKVTVVEYASMTCSHCAHFAKDVWPQIKKKYVDTNKIYFVFREFPLDNLAAAASMLARCAGGDKTFPLIEVLFEKQGDWAFVEGNPVPKMFEIAKQAESEGVRTLRQSGLHKVRLGVTSLEEVLGCTNV